jgi:hypothetical protein
MQHDAPPLPPTHTIYALLRVLYAVTEEVGDRGNMKQRQLGHLSVL